MSLTENPYNNSYTEEMLEALRYMVQVFGDKIGSECNERDAIRDARLVIKKAEASFRRIK